MNKNKLNNNVIINDKIEFNLAKFNDVNKIIKISSGLFKNLLKKELDELKKNLNNKQEETKKTKQNIKIQ